MFVGKDTSLIATCFFPPHRIIISLNFRQYLAKFHEIQWKSRNWSHVPARLISRIKTNNFVALLINTCFNWIEKVRPTTASRGRINFVAAKQKQITDKVASRTRRRGQVSIFLKKNSMKWISSVQVVPYDNFVVTQVAKKRKILKLAVV